MSIGKQMTILAQNESIALRPPRSSEREVAYPEEPAKQGLLKLPGIYWQLRCCITCTHRPTFFPPLWQLVVAASKQSHQISWIENGSLRYWRHRHCTAVSCSNRPSGGK